VDEPILEVGLLPGVDSARFVLDGAYDLVIDGRPSGTAPGGVELVARSGRGEVRVEGLASPLDTPGRLVRLIPRDDDASFLLRGVVVGVQFHWQHSEDLRFRGGINLRASERELDVVNAVPLEEYLVSVISSEMSAHCPPPLLRAHAVISRSWLLAQLMSGRTGGGRGEGSESARRDGEAGEIRIWRWYDREDHEDFDVCADDHCQRYQGVTRALTPEVGEAVASTRGWVLVHENEICDARFSKCCGGMTEVFDSAWGDQNVPYLQAFHDGPRGSREFEIPLRDEANARAFIDATPTAYCGTKDAALLARLLPEIDHETQDFYRWEIRLEQEEVRDLVKAKSGIDPGPIEKLEPRRRGPSGRLVELAVCGRDHILVVGKELEIRRLLSPTHLYSSAFVARAVGEPGRTPEAFVLRGAGWGHGVGLCQIGAAVMADLGHTHEQILEHYYRGAALVQVYDPP